MLRPRTTASEGPGAQEIALGLAAAAIAAPIAQAKVGEQAWPGIDPSEYAVKSVKASDYHMLRPSPHDPALARGGHGAAAKPHKPHRLGSALASEDSQASWSLISPGDHRSATAFDWGDAGIGSGFALALVLLGGGAALAARRVGREQTA